MDSGINKDRDVAEVFNYGLMEANMKVSGSKATSRVTESSPGRMVISIKAASKKISLMTN